MTVKSRMIWRLASAATGAMLLLAGALSAPASAQQSDPSARTVTSDQGVAGRPAPKPANGAAAKPVVRTDAAQKVKTNANTKISPETLGARGRPWTLEDAMPEHSASMRQYDPRPASPGIGRMPLQSGTVGFETKTQVNPNQTPDGATIRGQEATAARSSSYLGMSLSVPTDNKAMSFPLPWGQP